MAETGTSQGEMGSGKLKLIVALALLVLALLFRFAVGQNLTSILKQAQEQARLDQKPVLLDFYTSCPPCKAFDRDALFVDSIKLGLEKVHMVKIDAEQGDGLELANAYWVEHFPTFILLKPNGDVLSQWVGYRRVTFLRSLSQALLEFK